jgi:hypothetical protein
MTTNSNLENSSDNIDIFGGDEFVFTKIQNPDGTTQIIGGGYKVNSFFLQDGIPAMTTFNNSGLNNSGLNDSGLNDSGLNDSGLNDSGLNDSGLNDSGLNNNSQQSGGKVSSPFENLAVPAGLFYINQKIPKNSDLLAGDNHYKKHEMLSDDIMDKLFGLVEADKKRKRKTRKHIGNLTKGKTRKNL